MSPPLSEANGAVRLAVHVQPGARRDGVAGLHDGRLKIRVSAPPEDGRANSRLMEVVAAAFRLRKGDVVLASGASSRRKELILGGLGLNEARERLEMLLKSARDEADSP